METVPRGARCSCQHLGFSQRCCEIPPQARRDNSRWPPQGDSGCRFISRPGNSHPQHPAPLRPLLSPAKTLVLAQFGAGVGSALLAKKPQAAAPTGTRAALRQAAPMGEDPQRQLGRPESHKPQENPEANPLALELAPPARRLHGSAPPERLCPHFPASKRRCCTERCRTQL